MKKLALLVAVPVMAASSASALTIIDTYPDYTGNVTSNWFAVAQTITWPGPDDDVLDFYKFALAPGEKAGVVRLEIFEWSDTGPVGGALFSRERPWDPAGGDISTGIISLQLGHGSLYGVVVDLQGYSGQSVHYNTNRNSYTGGNGWWRNGAGEWMDFPSLNTKFRAEFIPEPATFAAVSFGLLALLRRWRKS